MRNKLAAILFVLLIFVGGFFLGRWVEGKRQTAICQVAITETEKRKDAEIAKAESGREEQSNRLMAQADRCWDAYFKLASR
jgi:hypothetical protein